MKNISFSLTTRQVRESTPDYILKDVTRRTGWAHLKPGEKLCAIVKGQGLKAGEHVERIRIIEVVSVRREPVNRMLNTPEGDPTYGIRECQREGFPEMSPSEFVQMFCKSHSCRPNKKITRIEFKYL